MSTSLFSKTPTVTVLDNRGLSVRDIAYHRHPDTPDITDERLTRHRYDFRGFLTQSADPRLHDAGLTNVSYLTDLTGDILRVQNADNGITVSLNDTAGRPSLSVSNISTADDGTEDRGQAVIRTWQYENAASPGRPVSVTEQVTGKAARITERFVYAGNSDAEKALNQAGQCVCHYDTAGLMQTDSIAITGVPLCVTRRLLKDADNPDTLADWQGTDVSAWNDQLAAETFTTRTTANATGAVLTTTDAKENTQRVAYNVAGQLSGSWLTLKGGKEQVIVASLTYSAAGQTLREEHGNGVVTTYCYEPETQRLIGVKTERPAGHNAGAKVLQDMRYEYDPVGNVLKITNDAEKTRFWRNQKVVPENAYVYDSLYQLVSASGREMASIGQQGSGLPSAAVPLSSDDSAYTNYIRTWTYDEAGNLTHIRHSAPATNNTYTTAITVSGANNRAVLSTLTDNPAHVDALFTAGGQQKQMQPGQNLVWTPRNELLKVTPVVRDGSVNDRESYRYDADSQRILKVTIQKTGTSTQTQRALYLPGLELRHSKSGETETQSLQVISVGEASRVRVLHWDSGRPDDISNDPVRYRYDNPTGSSQLELDADGNIMSMEEYYPYGGTAILTTRSQAEVNDKTIRYSGKERDATGLYYYGYRYYQPWVGRWLSADPGGTVDGLNLYRMARNNPLTFVDPDGRKPCPGTQLAGSHLYQPKLRTGNDRNRADASLVMPSRVDNITATGRPIKLEDALTEHAFSSTPLLTDLINPAKVDMDNTTQDMLANKDMVGGILAFNAIHFSITESNNINALRIVDKKTSAYQVGSGVTLAYWAPQGGYVDIPAHPQKGQPKLVLTPGFSGCTFVADKLNENTIRVRHVQGGKEDLEYNNLPDEAHGLGMISAMEYRDYGYHHDDQGNLKENITGSAFMAYEQNRWNIKYQSLACAPGISSLKEESTGLFKKRAQLTGAIRYSAGKNVIKTRVLPLHD